MNTPPQASNAAGPAAPIVARAGRYYRNARYLMFTIIVAMGAWFLYDGFVRYPAENRQYQELRTQLTALEKDPNAEEAKKLSLTIQLKNLTLHDDLSDILPQKLLG